MFARKVALSKLTGLGAIGESVNNRAGSPAVETNKRRTLILWLCLPFPLLSRAIKANTYHADNLVSHLHSAATVLLLQHSGDVAA